MPAAMRSPSPASSADMSWVRVLEHHAGRTPDKPLAVLRRSSRHVSREMAELVGAARRRDCAQRGVGVGDVVALLSYNSTEFLATIFAANHLGAIAMPINWRLAAAELRYLLEHSGAKVLVCDEDARSSSPTMPSRDSDRDLARVLRRRPHRSTGGSGSSTSRASRSPSERRCAGDDIHRLMYTSGTTGRPKGVMITHANLAWKNYAHITEFGFTSTDVGLACGPLYHVGALDLITTTMIAVGATTIIHRTFDAAEVVDEIERSRVTTRLDGAGDDAGGARRSPASTTAICRRCA